MKALGELVYVDVEKRGRIPDGGGWHAHRRASGSVIRDRSTKTGSDDVHSLLYDDSWLADSEILAHEEGAPGAGFLTSAIGYYAGHGITRIERLITDNAWACGWFARMRIAKDTGSANLPLHDFDQNHIWLIVVALVVELIAWMQMLALTGDHARRWERKKSTTTPVSNRGTDHPTFPQDPSTTVLDRTGLLLTALTRLAVRPKPT